VAHGPAFYRCSGGRVETNLDRTWLGWVSPEISESLKGVEVRVNGGGGPKPHVLAYLTN